MPTAGRRLGVSRVGIMSGLLLLSNAGAPSQRVFILAKMGHEVHRPAQPVEVEQGQGLGVGREHGQGGVIGPAHRDRDVGAVGAAHDEIGLSAGATTDADNLDALATERMMRAGNGDESRYCLGYRGSVLRVCQP